MPKVNVELKIDATACRNWLRALAVRNWFNGMYFDALDHRESVARSSSKAAADVALACYHRGDFASAVVWQYAEQLRRNAANRLRKKRLLCANELGVADLKRREFGA